MTNEHELIRSTYKKRKEAMKQTDYDTPRDRFIVLLLLIGLTALFFKFIV